MAEKDLRKAAIDINNRLINDHAFFCENVIKIAPKTGSSLVPMKLNESQLFAEHVAQKQLEDQGMVKLLILKARQQGMTTWSQSHAYAEAIKRSNWTSLAIAHNKAASENIGNMAVIMLNNDTIFSPKTKKDTYSKDEIHFVEPENSRYLIRTAGTKAEGRSYKLNFVHASEVAFWPANGAAIIGGLQETMPSGDRPGTWEIWETTANGFDPLFNGKWEEISAASRKGKKTDFLQLFLPWYFHREYSLKLEEEDREELLDTLDQKEKWLLRQRSPLGNPVTLGQLAWRRRKISNMTPSPGLTKEEFFRQEYPATPDEAFLSTGTVVFDRDRLEEWLVSPPRPIARYTLLADTGTVMSSEKGELAVLQEPRIGSRYVIGVDVAEGLPHGDASVAHVINHATKETVAEWHGRIPPESFAGVLSTLGRRYNNALMAVERNNHGTAVINRLLEMGYPNMYYEMAIDQPGAAPRRRVGWLTSIKTKPLLVSKIIAHMDENRVGPLLEADMREMMSFEAVPNTAGTAMKYQAQPGKCDDRVIAIGIAHTVSDVVPLKASGPRTMPVPEKPMQWGRV